MMFHKITHSVDYNQWLKRMNTHLNNLSIKIQSKSFKLLKQQTIKRYYKTLGTSVVNCKMSPHSHRRLSLQMSIVQNLAPATMFRAYI